MHTSKLRWLWPPHHFYQGDFDHPVISVEEILITLSFLLRGFWSLSFFSQGGFDHCHFWVKGVLITVIFESRGFWSRRFWASPLLEDWNIENRTKNYLIILHGIHSKSPLKLHSDQNPLNKNDRVVIIPLGKNDGRGGQSPAYFAYYGNAIRHFFIFHFSFIITWYMYTSVH